MPSANAPTPPIQLTLFDSVPDAEMAEEEAPHARPGRCMRPSRATHAKPSLLNRAVLRPRPRPSPATCRHCTATRVQRARSAWASMCSATS